MKKNNFHAIWQCLILFIVILVFLYPNQSIYAEELSRTVYCYEIDADLSTGNIAYVADTAIETEMKYLQNPEDNPTKLIKKWFEDNQINMNYYFPVLQPDDTCEKSLYYFFSQCSNVHDLPALNYSQIDNTFCQNFLTNLLLYIQSASDLEYLVPDTKWTYSILNNMPRFEYSAEDNCYYTYIQIYYRGLTYLLNLYFIPDSTGSSLKKVSFDFITSRYLQGDSSGSVQSFLKIDNSSILFTVALIEAIEYECTDIRNISSTYNTDTDTLLLESCHRTYLYSNGNKTAEEQYLFTKSEEYGNDCQTTQAFYWLTLD